MGNIQVGKFTLESLTTGMYSEPESCYREYIQNAVDSLDESISLGINSISDCRIEIIVDEQHQIITIKDNGTGLLKSDAVKTLLDIGNSSKTNSSNRGFRGIGRLGGLSYCKKLSFCTSSMGEDIKTVVTFDCDKLKKLLVPGQNLELDLSSVMEKVTKIDVLHEQETAHYFIVKMEGVDELSSLLDIELVKDYLSEVAPVPFVNNFFWAREIKEELLKFDYVISEYPIFVGDSFETLTQVFKPYRLSINISSRSAEVIKDNIESITYYKIYGSCEELVALGWYANTGFLGTLSDERISGIRMRQGNILIGTSRTLSQYFKDPRFNKWSLGELYIVSNKLIPNARRDDFEKNQVFTLFEENIRKTIGTEIPKKIRDASKARNNPSQKIINKAEKVISKAEEILESGFNSGFEKEQINKELDSVFKDVSTIPKSAKDEYIERKRSLITRIDLLKQDVENSSNYKAKEAASSFSKEEKRIIQAVLEVLSKNFERETVDSLYAEILSELKRKGKK